MSDIELKEVFRQKAIDLINEYRVQQCLEPIVWLEITTPQVSAFIRSIQLHENTKKELADCKQELADFRQEVSDAVEAYDNCDSEWESETLWPVLAGFIIPKPDPLVEALCEMDPDNMPNEADAENLRAALEARGLEIREKNDEN